MFALRKLDHGANKPRSLLRTAASSPLLRAEGGTGKSGRSESDANGGINSRRRRNATKVVVL
jgi:hypothetical protein